MRNTVAWKSIIGGESSNRPQHLAFNDTWHKFLWIACPIASISMSVSALNQGVEMGFVWQLWFVPPLFRFNEVFSPPDNDEAFKVNGFRGWYWTPYSRIFKHRSIWSHSLLFGTPLRFCIAYWLPILLFVLGWNWQVIQTTESYNIEMLSKFTFPHEAGILFPSPYGEVV